MIHRALEYEQAERHLRSAIDMAEHDALVGGHNFPQDEDSYSHDLNVLFASSTQAFREALVGCILARLNDPTIDASKPYVKHGANAYNGRTLCSKVVTPILRDKQIPVSTGPFLSALRRGVRFTETMRIGIRDQDAFTAFLSIVGHINRLDEDLLTSLLVKFCIRFVGLREAANVRISKLQRISHEQYGILIDGLLKISSGGRFPMFLAEALFHAICLAFELDWKIIVQGINVSDSASGAGGDVEIWRGDELVLAAEITERRIDTTRVQATFQSKISPFSIQDYLFLVTNDADAEAIAQARRYFIQGHEVNFVNLRDYILMMLVSVGSHGRERFNRVLTERIENADTPTTLKVAWNAQITRLTEA